MPSAKSGKEKIYQLLLSYYTVEDYYTVDYYTVELFTISCNDIILIM